MSNRRAIFWLIVLSLFAIAANVALPRHSTVARRSKVSSAIDLSFAPVRIVLARTGSRPMILERDRRWRLVSPYAGQADESAVLRLVDAVSFSPVTDVLSQAELLRLGRTLADFRLESPALTVTFEGQGRRSTLSFGDLTPTSNGVYAVTGPTEDVLVLPESVYRAVNLGAESFRDRDVFSEGSESVVSFEVRQPGGAGFLEFVRAGAGWRMGEQTASSTKVGDLLSRLAALKTADFVWPVGASNELKSASVPLLSGYGLDPETAVTLTLHCSDGSDRSVAFGNAAGTGKVYALVHNGGEIVTVDDSVCDIARQKPIRFTDARLFPLTESAVSVFALAAGEDSYVVAREDGGGWRLDAPIVAPADSETVRGLLDRVLSLTAADVVSDGVRVTVNSNLSQAVVSETALWNVARPEALRSREILKVDSAQVRRVVSSVAGAKPLSVLYDRTRRAWSVETPGDVSAVDEKAVLRLLGELAPLRAQRIVALKVLPADLAKYGLETPHAVISIDQEKDGSLRRNILIGAPVLGGGRYATVGSSDAIFILSDNTVAALLASLVGC